jgi:hypothetical protein
MADQPAANFNMILPLGAEQRRPRGFFPTDVAGEKFISHSVKRKAANWVQCK